MNDLASYGFDYSNALAYTFVLGLMYSFMADYAKKIQSEEEESLRKMKETKAKKISEIENIHEESPMSKGIIEMFNIEYDTYAKKKIDRDFKVKRNLLTLDTYLLIGILALLALRLFNNLKDSNLLNFFLHAIIIFSLFSLCATLHYLYAKDKKSDSLEDKVDIFLEHGVDPMMEDSPFFKTPF